MSRTTAWVAVALALGLGLRIAATSLISAGEQSVDVPDSSISTQAAGDPRDDGPAREAKAPEHLSPTPSLERFKRIASWAADASLEDLRNWVASVPVELTKLEWRVVLTRWAELDAEGMVAGALAAAKSNDHQTERTESFALMVLAEVDGETALALTPEDGGIARDVSKAAIVRDPFAVIRSWQEGDDPDLLVAAYRSWFRQDRAAALQALEEMPQGETRQGVYMELAGLWARESPENAIAWVLEATKDDKDLQENLLGAIADSMAESNPLDIWELVKTFGRDPEDPRLMMLGQDIVEMAAYRDPNDVLEWLHELGNDEVSAIVVSGSAHIHRRPEVAAVWLEKFPPGETREALAAGMLTHQHDKLSEQLTALEELEGVDRERMVENLLERSQFNSREVADAVDGWKDLPEESRLEIVGRTVRMWSAMDNPAAAADWLGSLPESFVQPKHFSDLWNSWTSIYPGEASTALAAMPSGPLRDGAISGLIDQVALGKQVVIPDYEGAWQWAKQISSPNLKAEFEETLASRWREHNPAKAAAVLDHESP